MLLYLGEVTGCTLSPVHREIYFIYLLTEYRMGVHPSMLTHWNTVNMANPMLSKEVMPKLGPVHFSKQTEVRGSQVKAPIGAS